MISEKQWGILLNIWFTVLLLYTAVNTVGDSYALLTGGVATRLVSYTPIWVKLFKDVLMAIAILMIVFHRIRLDSRLLVGILSWLALGAVYAVVWFQELGNVVFMGIRYMLPAIYLLFGYSFRNHSIAKIKPAVGALLVLHVIMQVLQAVFAPNFFGHTLFGFNLRNTGLFITPTFSGAFPLICFYWPGAGLPLRALAVSSVVLSNSTTCTFVLVVITGKWLLQRLRPRYRLFVGGSLTILILPVILFFLPQISGRGDAVWVSSASRGSIVAENSRYILTLGEGFGLGTSMAVLQKIPNAIIADNTLVSSLVSMGGIGMVATSGILLLTAFGLYRRSIGLMLLFIGMAMTVIIFESTPFSQILFFWAGQNLHLLMRRSSNTMTQSSRVALQ